MGLLGAAYVEISANAEKLRKGLLTAKADTNKFLKDVDKTLKVIDFMPIIKNIGMIGYRIASITAPITATTAAIFALAKTTANAGEELLKMHEKTGISVEELYALKKVAALSNISLGDLSVSLKILSQHIIEARTKAGEMRDTFKALEIDTTKPLMDIFMQLAKRLNEYTDGEAKTALATKLMGRSGQDILPVFKDLADKGLVLSKVWDEETARAANEFNDNLTILKQTVTELGQSLGNKVIPYLNEFMTVLNKGGLDKAGEDWLNQIRKDLEDIGTLAGKGITKFEDLPFMFEGKIFQPPKEVPIIVDTKELEREKREAERTAKTIADAYKDMYSALKFDTEKYYNFQKDLLQKRRDEEIKVTGDIKLAWEAYYARLAELDEQRLARSNEISDGIKLFFAEQAREGFTWASATKEALDSIAKSGASGIADMLKSIETGTEVTWQSILGSFLDMMNKMIAEWLVFQIIMGFGKIFGRAATSSSSMGSFGTPTGGGDLGGGSFLAAPPAPTTSTMMGAPRTSSEPVVVNQSMHFNLQEPIDAYAFDRYLKQNKGTIQTLVGEGVTRSRSYARQIRGKERI